ncbi:MAG: PQQ-dependent sugar dehydrogenase [Verrucomicrobia bacterium]|nr:PQQ-dependent sugar dehydrogenase [Verrucomicrobiota bacterium]
MAGGSRSIAINLTPDLHLAFDTTLLHTEAAWRGPGLNLLGPPYTGRKAPFICNYDGVTLWTLPPIFPWSAEGVPGEVLRPPPPGSGFRGLSTKAGLTALIYDVALPNGQTIRVHEIPRAVPMADEMPIARRLEIAPSPSDLWWLAQAEMGRLVPSLARADAPVSPGSGGAGGTGLAAVLIQRKNDLLLAVAHGAPGLSWQTVETNFSYPVEIVTEQGTETGNPVRVVSGHQTRAWLKIPAHRKPIAVEVVTRILPPGSDIAACAKQLEELKIAPPNMEFVARREKLPAALSSALPRPRRLTSQGVFGWPAGGDKSYRIEHFPLPPEINLRVTGMDFLSKGDLAVCTWSGEVWIVEHPTGPVQAATYRRFARGLDEPLGLKVIGDLIYVVQKCELTRLVDTEGDGQADLYETINADWGFTGNYHAFAFGPLVDRQNYFYVAITGLHARWEVPFASWCLRISPDGRRVEPFCSGFRVPNGFGFYGPNNDIFFTDNEGEWLGACKLNHLEPGKYYGFPAASPAPRAAYGKTNAFQPPAIWFPRKLAPSASGMVAMPEGFGPFAGQLLVGDFQLAGVVRVALEKVNGEWQGAVWPFAKGFLSGVNRLAFGPDGKLYVGGLKSPAWAAIAPKDYSLDRVSFTGKTPFEVKEVHARPDGFELVFTEPVDPAAAGNADNYDADQFGYLYRPKYGSPEMDRSGKPDSSTPVRVVKATVSADRLTVRLKLEDWAAGFVTRVHAMDVKGADGQPLWHDTFYYTLNQIPAK